MRNTIFECLRASTYFSLDFSGSTRSQINKQRNDRADPFFSILFSKKSFFFTFDDSRFRSTLDKCGSDVLETFLGSELSSKIVLARSSLLVLLPYCWTTDHKFLESLSPSVLLDYRSQIS